MHSADYALFCDSSGWTLHTICNQFIAAVGMPKRFKSYGKKKSVDFQLSMNTCVVLLTVSDFTCERAVTLHDAGRHLCYFFFKYVR